MSKRKIIHISIIMLALIILLGGITIFAVSNAKKDQDTLDSRIEAALGGEYKKQTETVVATTVTYADKNGNKILYHYLKTTYFEADPSEVTGLDVNALCVLFDLKLAKDCD